MSEVSQKEKNKYYILIEHIYHLEENGTNEPTCRAGIEKQM